MSNHNSARAINLNHSQRDNARARRKVWRAARLAAFEQSGRELRRYYYALLGVVGLWIAGLWGIAITWAAYLTGA